MEDQRNCDELCIEHQSNLNGILGILLGCSPKKLDIIGVSWVYDGDITNYVLTQYGGYVKITILCGAVSL